MEFIWHRRDRYIFILFINFFVYGTCFLSLYTYNYIPLAFFLEFFFGGIKTNTLSLSLQLSLFLSSFLNFIILSLSSPHTRWESDEVNTTMFFNISLKIFRPLFLFSKVVNARPERFMHANCKLMLIPQSPHCSEFFTFLRFYGNDERKNRIKRQIYTLIFNNQTI